MTGHIILHGSYYTNNFGDILLMRLFKEWMEEHPTRPTVCVPFLTKSAGGQFSRRSERWKEVLASRALVLGGGGYFSEPEEDPQRWGMRMLLRYSLIVRAHQVRGRPYGIFGVGVGPISNKLARREVVRMFEGARFSSVRDEASLEHLRKYGLRSVDVEVVADAAIALDGKDVAPGSLPATELLDARTDEPITIAVHLSYPSTYSLASKRLIAGLTKSLGNEHIRVLAITDQKGAAGQLEAADELRMELGDRCRVIPYEDPEALTALIGRVNGVVTTKLHVGIVAATQGLPVLSIPTHVKTPRFYAQIGRAHRCVPLNEVTQVDGAVTMLVDNFLKTGCGDPHIPESVVRGALRNRELVHAFLDSIDS